jgi:glycosyltransferase involved in cell wall biosynthesis
MDATTGQFQPIELSMVIPVFNEEENLPILIPKLAESEGLGGCEMIVVTGVG